MNDYYKVIIRGPRHGFWVGMTGDRRRLNQMREEVAELQRRLALKSEPASAERPTTDTDYEI